MNYPYPSGPRNTVTRLPAHPWRARRSRRISPWWLFAAAMLVISMALLPLLLLGGAAAYYGMTGKAYPGVRVGDIPVGDLNAAQIAERLSNDWNEKRQLALLDGANAWPVKPSDLGLLLDAQASAQRALEFGRGTGSLGEVIWLIRFGEWQVEPVIVYDPSAARAGVEKIAAQVNVPAQNATLRIENGQWIAVPGQYGRALDVESVLTQLPARGREILRTKAVPATTFSIAPQLMDATPALERLQAALDTPLKLQAYDPVTNETLDWSIPRDAFASWVTVSMEGDDIVIGLDAQPLNGYLQAKQANLGGSRVIDGFTPPADLVEYWQSGRPLTVTVRHMPTTYTVEPGDTLTRIAFKVGMPYWMIQRANPEIDPDRLRAGQVLTIPSKNDLLPLPAIPGKRVVISISQQRMWIYENGGLRSEHPISTGIDRSPTIPGVYQIQTHEVEAYASVWDLYMPHFMGIYEGWPGFMNGIHGLPTLSNGQRLWAGNLGRPVSYGCIILGLREAEELFNWAEEGVIVEIQP